MSKQLVLTFQSDTYQRAGQQFDNNPFASSLYCLGTHGRVKTQGPLSVTATICSKCAE